MSEAEEPSSTSKEMDIQKRTEEEGNSQKRDENTPLIVLITEENKHRVSKKDNGMLRAPDGSLQRTPQYVTWNDNRHLQLRDDTEVAPNMPAHIAQETPDHPKPAKVNQYWSYGGEWVMVPLKPSDQGAWLNNWRPGRIEPVIDINGKLVKVLSYGEGAEELTVWFWLEDILKLFPDWIIPAPPKFFNNKKFNKLTLRDSSTYRANNQGNQGYRGNRGASGSGNGNYRGRDFSNGNYRSQDRGRRDRNYSPGSDRDGRNGGRGQGYNR